MQPTAPSATCWRASRKIIRSGTPNGIRMDADSALIWSPSHFTWMDTNHPAGTPREGYPVEIQALWIRLLRQLEKISAPAEQKKWRDLADRATASFEKLFWLEDKGWFADVLLAEPRRHRPRRHAERRAAQQLSVRRQPRPGDRRTRQTLCRGRAKISGRAGRVALAGAAAGFRAAAGLRQRRPAFEQSGRAVLAALRRRRGHAPQTGLSQRHGVDVDVPDLLRGAGAGVGFCAGSRRGGERRIWAAWNN